MIEFLKKYRVKFCILFILVVHDNLLFAQLHLSEFDTAINYREVFYPENKLWAPNRFELIDSVWVHDHWEIVPDSLRKQKTGNWIEYNDKNNNYCDSLKAETYKLSQFYDGECIGKAYIFTKEGRLLTIRKRFPVLYNSIFEGYLEIDLDKKGRVKWIELRKFIDDSTKSNFYYQAYFYFKDGTLESYSLLDDSNYKYNTQRYNRNGDCTYELIHSKTISFIVKTRYRRNRTIVRREIKRKRTKEIYRNGILVKEKVIRF